MHYALEGLRRNVKVLYQPQKYTIDNLVFQLHYRFTAAFLFTGAILLSCQHHFGDNIKCLCDKNTFPEEMLNGYCYIQTTYTIPKYNDPLLLKQENIAHIGIGPIGILSKEEVTRHNYYQWVYFVLAIQGVMFMIPHLIWKGYEGGRLRRLVEGLHFAAFSFADKDLVIGKETIPCKKVKNQRMDRIKATFIDRLYANRIWSLQLIFCETLNLLNIIFQIYITHVFLGRQFLKLGIQLFSWEDSTVNILDIVFPKVTKCDFRKYGPSGSIQHHDALCVMANNIVNEKIYSFLWFWFFFLLLATIAGLLWRLVTLCVHAKSEKFNEIVFSYTCPGKLNPWRVLTVTRHCDYTDWLFLRYLSKNLDGFVFRDIFIGLAKELEPNKLLDDYDGNDRDDKKSDKENLSLIFQISRF